MDKSIRVGILFSLSGTMEISERGQYQAALLAIEEVNRNGGVTGEKSGPLLRIQPPILISRQEKQND